MIFILTGAGISAESGLGTFRDVGGLWDQYDLAEVATPEGYQRNPGLVLDFYNARRENLLGAEPNAAHRAIARLQAAQEVYLVTQNIDDLHERGGSTQVHHMHGQLMRSLCAACGARSDAPAVIALDDACRSCGAKRLRPDVVWFGEMPYGMDDIYKKLYDSSLFVAIGTSGQVYPAAGFVAEARGADIPCLELNLEPSDTGELFSARKIGPATEVVPAWVEEVLAG